MKKLPAHLRLHRRTIVDRKPTSTTEITIMGDGAVLKTRTAAETGVKSYKVCTRNQRSTSSSKRSRPP